MTTRTMPQLVVTLESIASELDGQEWNADTLDRIAEIMRDAGYTIREPEVWTPEDAARAFGPYDPRAKAVQS